MPTPKLRHIAFLTGTRAEFGLMERTLRAIQSHPHLRLSLLATGMHLDPRHGHTLRDLQRRGWHIDATIPWPAPRRSAAAGSPLPPSSILHRPSSSLALHTANATANIARALDRLNPDLLLVTGDRVEAFAAATAAHLSNRLLAHVHGGDRALGQLDDSLRHAITKLSHLHFPATKQSAQRIRKLGEDPWRIHLVGSPGLDGIQQDAARRAELLKHFPLRPHRYALLILHPASPDPALEESRARSVLDATLAANLDHLVIIYPNNDPGTPGILKVWDEITRAKINMITTRKDVPRPLFLALLRDAAALVGNSSAGIIEAASFGTPVLDIGPRQLGRERSPNVTHLPTYAPKPITRALARIWNAGRPSRYRGPNVYGAGHASARIATILSALPTDTDRLRRKLIAY